MVSRKLSSACGDAGTQAPSLSSVPLPSLGPHGHLHLSGRKETRGEGEAPSFPPRPDQTSTFVISIPVPLAAA